jgi:hypothetical protein
MTIGSEVAIGHAALRSASKRLSQQSSWFQLAKIRLTTFFVCFSVSRSNADGRSAV